MQSQHVNHSDRDRLRMVACLPQPAHQRMHLLLDLDEQCLLRAQVPGGQPVPEENERQIEEHASPEQKCHVQWAAVGGVLEQPVNVGVFQLHGFRPHRHLFARWQLWEDKAEADSGQTQFEVQGSEQSDRGQVQDIRLAGVWLVLFGGRCGGDGQGGRATTQDQNRQA